MSAKLTEDAKRGDLWFINPHEAVLVGFDDGYLPDLDNDCYDENRLRKLQDKNSIRLLKESIIENGENIEPVVLKKKKNAKGEEYLAVNAGRRRTMACREAFDELAKQGIPFKMKVILADKNEESAATFGRLISENANREDNTPTERARDFARFVKFSGDSLERISKETMASARARFGADDSTLKNWLVLLGLAVPVQRLVDSGALAQSIVRELKDLPHEEQVVKAKEYAEIAKTEGKGANLLGKARAEGQKRKGTVGADEHEGLSRGTMLGIWKLIQEDKEAGKEPKITDGIKLLEACIGKRPVEQVGGLKHYTDRLAEKKKERAQKKETAAAAE